MYNIPSLRQIIPFDGKATAVGQKGKNHPCDKQAPSPPWDWPLQIRDERYLQ
jgi:hypothetical protein